MEPKSKKNGIKNKSDFKTKLEGRMARSGPRTWPGQAPLGASYMRARSFLKTKNQSINQPINQGKKGPKDEGMNGRRDEGMISG